MSLATAAIVSVTKNEENHENIVQFLTSELIKHKIDTNVIKLESTNDKFTEEMAVLNENYNFVFVFGENCVIFDAISAVFEEKLVKSKHLENIYNIGNDCTDMKKAIIPNKSTILQVQDHLNGINPITIQYRNIYVIPDDVNSVKAIYNNILSSLILGGKEQFQKIYRIKSCQNGLGNVFHEVLNKHHGLDLKYFCEIQSNSCTLNIKLSGSDFKTFIDGEVCLKQKFPNNGTIQGTICDNFWKSVEKLNDKYISEAIYVIKECYLKYQPNEVFLSFNGGKDCTVLLYLVLYVLKKLHPSYNEPLLCLYIQSQSPFVEVEDFIKQCQHFYNLEVVTISSDVKTGLASMLDGHTYLKACLMGTRRTDPYSENLNHFHMTDKNWPQVMRVNPIINWKYSEIWDFLLKTAIPYCVLYDRGFTSLGSSTNTIPNPSLKCPDSDDYLPAYNLVDGSQERHGRLKK